MATGRLAALAAVLILGSLALAAAFGLVSAEVSVTRFQPEEVRTETMYDSGAKRLQLRCVSATQGLCRFKVESAGRSRIFAMKSGAGVAIAGVDPHARICSGGRNPFAEPCAWTYVS